MLKLEIKGFYLPRSFRDDLNLGASARLNQGALLELKVEKHPLWNFHAGKDLMVGFRGEKL